jgi:hypothetical protein
VLDILILKEFISRLKPYADKVCYFPLTELEVQNKEVEFSVKFPSFYSDFLITFGITQDVVPEFWTTLDEYDERLRLTLDALKGDFIPVADSLEGKLLIHIAGSDKLVLWQYWIDHHEPEELQESFYNFVNQRVDQVAADEERYPNTRKVWSTQFSIATSLPAVFLDKLGVTLLNDWQHVETTEAGVGVFQSTLSLNGESTPFVRQEYSGWNTPIYYFDYLEPVSRILQTDFSVIKHIDSLLRELPGYQMTDYGILSTDIHYDS